jgi:hypothetical protein
LFHQFYQPMKLTATRADTLAEDDDIVTEVAPAARGILHAAFGGDAADDNRPNAIAALHEIEVGADEVVGSALMKELDLLPTVPVPLVV